METASANMYKEKSIRGFCHLSSGQEAICVGIKAALRPVDTVITAYRYSWQATRSQSHDTSVVTGWSRLLNLKIF
jgi:pyruvate dehydrogenase E1 component alpha subunit